MIWLDSTKTTAQPSVFLDHPAPSQLNSIHISILKPSPLHIVHQSSDLVILDHLVEPAL